MDTTFLQSYNDKSCVLNDINMLLMSETSIMETDLQSKYQYMKTGDSSFLLEGLADMSEKILEATEDFTKEVSDFQKTVNAEMTNLNDAHGETNAENLLDKVDDVDFVFSGYNFKTLDARRINFFELDNMVSDYNRLVGDIISSIGDVDELDNIETESLYYLDEEYLSKVRARMLGTGRTIHIDDFLDYVKSYYRGSTTTVNITVDKDYIRNISKERTKIIKDRDVTMKELSRALLTFGSFSRCINLTIGSLSPSRDTYSISKVSKDSKGFISNGRTFRIDKSVDPQSLYKVTSILRLAYSRLIKVQSIAQIILSERLNALRDQSVQNIQVLNNLNKYVSNKIRLENNPDYSLLENLRSISDNSAQFYAHPVTDYTNYALEQFIINHSGDISSLEKRYLQESFFVKKCLENMYVDTAYAIMEASEASIKDRLVEFLNKIIGFFRKKMVEYNNKYKADIVNLYKKGTLADKAKSYNDQIEILPYWKVTNIDQDRNLIKTALTKGASNKELDDLSYMSSLVSISNVSEWDDKKGQLRGYLLNYFRCHEKDAEQVKKIKVSGADILPKIKIMVDYISGYDKIATGLDNLKREAETQISSLAGVQESLKFLEIEQRPIELSDISLLEGFSALLEADDNEPKAGETVGTDGEKASPTSADTTDSNSSDSSSNSEDKKDDAKPTSSRYANIYERFVELAITAYMTACEERYISYINILRTINGGAFSSDKDNKTDRKKENKGNTERVTDSTLYTESYFNKPSGLKGTSLYKL